MEISLTESAPPGRCRPNPVIVIMAKVPEAGEVKTRLMPPLSASQAAALAGCFLQDTVAKAMSICHVIIAHPPVENAALRAALQAQLPPCLRWMEQRGHDLGERLTSAAEDAFQLGFKPVIIIGADSPTLPAQYLTMAISALAEDESDVVVGPAEDGGYYLVGINAAQPGLFSDVEWSSAQTCAQTAENARRLGLRIAPVPRWYDVDTPADLERLRHEFGVSPQAADQSPATHEWLKSFYGQNDAE